MFTRTTALTRGVALAALAIVSLLAAQSPAGAHGDDAFLTVDQTHPADGSTHYILKMTYEDGDAVSGKVVTATPTGPDGQPRAVVTMAPSDGGVYQGTIPMPEPGTWKVRFASADPKAAVEATAEVTAPTTTTTEATTTTTEASTTTTATEDEGDDEIDGDNASSTKDDDDSSSSGPLILLGLLALLVVGAGAVFMFRRDNSGPVSGSDEPTDES